MQLKLMNCHCLNSVMFAQGGGGLGGWLGGGGLGSGGLGGGGGLGCSGSGGGGGEGGGDGEDDDDECVFVREDDAEMLNLPHARFDCRK